MTSIEHLDGPQSFARAYNVSRETLEHFQIYEKLLRQWQMRFNLVASSTIDDIWHRHMGDSAQLLQLVFNKTNQLDSGNWLDLGSGAGFPGLVIAILMAERPDFKIHLVESRSRKCAFLHEVARQTKTSVEIHRCRIETLASTSRLDKVEVVSARAVAPLTGLLELAVPFMGPETRGLFLKGAEAEREIDDARKSWDFSLRRVASRTAHNSVILEISQPVRKK